MGLGLIAPLLAALGCEPPTADLVVAALAVPADRAEFAGRFDDWRAAHNAAPVRIRWITVNPGATLERLDRFRPKPDLLLTPGDAADGEDPRRSPASLRRARSRIATQGWDAGWRTLVESYSRGEPVDRQREASQVLPLVAEISLNARDRGAVDDLIAFLVATPVEPPSLADDLLADLIGSVLIDAHEELIAADGVVAPDRQESELARQPTWPPESIIRLRERPDGDELIASLTAELTEDPDSRRWLMTSWTEAGPVDSQRLDAIAGAAGGRLARSSPFRTWLRAEWTAWARRVYTEAARGAVSR